jgi:hypothetical protein
MLEKSMTVQSVQLHKLNIITFVGLFLSATTPCSSQQADILNKTIVANNANYTMSHYIDQSGHVFSTDNQWGEGRRGPEYQIGKTITATNPARCLTFKYRTNATLSGNVLSLVVLDITSFTPKGCAMSPGTDKIAGFSIKIQLNGDTCTHTHSNGGTATNCKILPGRHVSE